MVLPEALAAAAVVEYFGREGVSDVVVTHDRQMIARHGLDLRDDQWAIIVPLSAFGALARALPPSELDEVYRSGQTLLLVQPSFSLALNARHAAYLKRALDDVRPKQPGGLPHPWVVLSAPTERLGRVADEHDVVSADTAEPEGAEFERPPRLSSETIRADFERLRQHLGLPELPLKIRRGAVHKQGFVTGRVRLDPPRMTLTTCPNSDRAEAAATLTHECAHLMVGAPGHGRVFRRTLVDLAGALWGVDYFSAARDALDEDASVVDAWIACGIRASLAGGRPPVAVHPEDAQAAIIVRRIQKLQALAADQLGTPEGCTAAARANDLIVTYGLGAYQVALPADLGGEMCDQWIHIGRRKPWKAKVAFAVARFCDVFALSSTHYGGMHLFGRYADVVTAEYLIAVAVERIERRCEAHIARWRADLPYLKGSAVVSQRASFLNSAAYGLSEALIDAKADADGVPPGTPAPALDFAERFARVEHEKRGKGWASGGRRAHRHNAAGFEAGNSLTLSKGLGGRRGPAGLLE